MALISISFPTELFNKTSRTSPGARERERRADCVQRAPVPPKRGQTGGGEVQFCAQLPDTTEEEGHLNAFAKVSRKTP